MQDPDLSIKHHELPFVRGMFDTIAPHYDFLNRFLSLRRDVHWRRRLVSALALHRDTRVLDVACGTGDVGLQILQGAPCKNAAAPATTVIGVDFATKMLHSARPKIEKASVGRSLHLVAADAFELPFAPDSFDAVTIAFGIRNIKNKIGALKSFYSVLKPGGRVAILELATPDAGVLRQIYLSYFNRLLPFVGRFFSKHSFAYSYLPDSVALFPPAREFADIMRQAGFEKVRYRKLTLGIAVVFVGDKTDRS